MKLNLGKITTLALAVLCVSCTGYSKLLKSSDNEAKYRKGLEYYERGKYTKSVELLANVANFYQHTDKEDSVIYYVGASLYKQGDFLSSEDIFRSFREEYSNGSSPFLEDVEYMYTKGFYYMSPEPNRDQTSTYKAMAAIDEYLHQYPNSTKRDVLISNKIELTQKLYDKAKINSELYYKTKHYRSAIIALRHAIEAFPESNHNEELSYLIVSSCYEYARKSIETKQRDRYMDLQDAYISFISDYPESKLRRSAEKMNDDAKEYLTKFGATDNLSDSTAVLTIPGLEAPAAKTGTLSIPSSVK